MYRKSLHVKLGPLREFSKKLDEMHRGSKYPVDESKITPVRAVKTEVPPFPKERVEISILALQQSQNRPDYLKFS